MPCILVGSLEKLGLSSYGVQSTSLEEVFLYLASHSSVLDAAEDAVPPHEHRPSSSSAVQPHVPQASSGDARATAGGTADESDRRGSEPTAASAATATRDARASSVSASALSPAIVDTYVFALTEGVPFT